MPIEILFQRARAKSSCCKILNSFYYVKIKKNNGKVPQLIFRNNFAKVKYSL